MGERSRRSVLAVGTAALAALAGCRGDGADSPTSGETPTRTGTAEDMPLTDGGTPTDDGANATDGDDDTGTDTDTSTGTATADLDLREANVVGVEFEAEGGSYRFDVTLYHDDDGEDGYADWWQVERLDGTRLGRRTLLHAHSTAPFTRSETIDVPDDVTCVVVRGHDQTHGYGGRATLVNLDTGATRAVDQGSEKRSFAESDCP